MSLESEEWDVEESDQWRRDEVVLKCLKTDEKVDELYPEMDYFMNEPLSDVVFVVEEKRIPANKEFISIRSKVFRAMFSGNFKESDEKEIKIEDTTYEAFKTLIRFLYCDRMVLIDDNDYDLVREVCRVADRYQVFRLIQRIGEHFKNKIRLENLKYISGIAFDYKIEVLVKKVKEFIKTNFNQLVTKDINELKQINDSTHNTMFEIVVKSYRKTEHFFRPFTQTYKHSCPHSGGHTYYTVSSNSYSGQFDLNPRAFNFDKILDN